MKQNGSKTSEKVSHARWRYITDEAVTLKELAAELGISYQYLKNKAAHERWAQQRVDFRANVIEEASKRVGVEVASLAGAHHKLARKAVETAWPIFLEKAGELSASEAWRVLREATELERKSTLIEEQVRAEVIENLRLLLIVARRLLSTEQFAELEDRLLEASGVM